MKIVRVALRIASGVVFTMDSGAKVVFAAWEMFAECMDWSIRQCEERLK